MQLQQRNSIWLAYGLVIALSALAYAIHMTGLGLYWDDWLDMWLGYVPGPQALADSQASDRPVMGYILALHHRLWGDHILLWHIAAFAVRTLGGVFLLWGLQALWQDKLYANTAIASLFVIYPAYMQQPFANITQAHLLTVTLAMLSIALTIHAQKAASQRFLQFTLAALLVQASYVIITEYFIAFEAFRLIVIYLAQPNLSRAIKHYLPYSVVAGIFVIWRFVIFSPEREAVQGDVIAESLKQPMEVLSKSTQNTIDSIIGAWNAPLRYRFDFVDDQIILVALLVGLVGAALMVGYLIMQPRQRGFSRPFLIESAWLAISTAWFVVAILTQLSDRNHLHEVIFGALLIGGYGVWRQQSQSKMVYLGLTALMGGILAIWMLLPQSSKLAIPPAVALGVAVIASEGWARRNPQTTSDIQDNRWAGQVIVIGIFMTFFTLLVVRISGRYPIFNTLEDRYFLPPALGVALVMVGVICLLPERVRPFLLGFLVLLSISTHYLNGYLYKEDWAQQQDFWWQLVWRAPEFEPDVLLIIDPPERFGNHLIRDHEYYTALGIIYHPTEIDIHLSGRRLLELEIMEPLANSEQREGGARNSTHIQRYDRPIIVTKPNDTACLHIIHPDYEEYPADASSTLKEFGHYSQPNLIIADAEPPQPPSNIFGNEPPHTWCYFYQQAELARQQGNWAQIVALAQTVEQENFSPHDPVEWLPFIEAYLQLDQPADFLIERVPPDNPYLQNLLTRLTSIGS